MSSLCCCYPAPPRGTEVAALSQNVCNESEKSTTVATEDGFNEKIRAAILHNAPIEENLHVIMVISNPCHFVRRRMLALEFIARMQKEANVILYVVELVYGSDKWEVTEAANPRHLQLRLANDPPLWHKENMINIGVRRLLPADWKAFAWIDADLEFDNPLWAQHTLKVLNGCCDIVQIWSHAVDMNMRQDAMNVFASFGFQYVKGREYSSTDVKRMWHPGFAWAITREAYEKIGGLYEVGILGAGDHIMAMALIGLGSVHKSTHPDYQKSISDVKNKVFGLKLGYVPGVIRHFFHGTKESRKYLERWQILVKYEYSPMKHLTHNADGLLVPTEECPREMLLEIREYFRQRNEDYGYLESHEKKLDNSVVLAERSAFRAYAFIEDRSSFCEKKAPVREVMLYHRDLLPYPYQEELGRGRAYDPNNDEEEPSCCCVSCCRWCRRLGEDSVSCLKYYCQRPPSDDSKEYCSNCSWSLCSHIFLCCGLCSRRGGGGGFLPFF